jgi:hypothetical protein
VILVVRGLLLSGAESLSGVVRVARHDVRITATGDLVGSAGPVFVVSRLHRRRAVPHRLAGLAGGPGPHLPLGWCWRPRICCRTSRLRHTVDLDAVRDDLTSVVEQAFQPTQVSVWLALPRREAVSGKIVS